MAAKNTLKYKRNRLPPMIEILDNSIARCLEALDDPGVKASFTDLTTLIRLRLKLQPEDQTPPRVVWVDQEAPA